MVKILLHFSFSQGVSFKMALVGPSTSFVIPSLLWLLKKGKRCHNPSFTRFFFNFRYATKNEEKELCVSPTSRLSYPHRSETTRETETIQKAQSLQLTSTSPKKPQDIRRVNNPLQESMQ
jgi:hypothetical protein